ncbi:unnamed protein product [Amoebophrya sp. A120]|nr:unnamed protein product [Amoebophrya sp. A120]|eukprot:GSA120T00018548001.1
MVGGSWSSVLSSTSGGGLLQQLLDEGWDSLMRSTSSRKAGRGCIADLPPVLHERRAQHASAFFAAPSSGSGPHGTRSTRQEQDLNSQPSGFFEIRKTKTKAFKRTQLRTAFKEDDLGKVTDQKEDGKTEPEKDPPMPKWANTEGYGTVKVTKPSDYYTLDDIEDPVYACKVDDFKPAAAHPMLKIKKEFLDANADFKNNVYFYKVQLGADKDGKVDEDNILWDGTYAVGRFKETDLSNSMFATDGKRKTFWKFCPKEDSGKYRLVVEAQDKRGKPIPGWTPEGGTSEITCTKGKEGQKHPLGEPPEGGATETDEEKAAKKEEMDKMEEGKEE